LTTNFHICTKILPCFGTRRLDARQERPSWRSHKKLSEIGDRRAASRAQPRRWSLVESDDGRSLKALAGLATLALSGNAWGTGEPFHSRRVRRDGRRDRRDLYYNLAATCFSSLRSLRPSLRTLRESSLRLPEQGLRRSPGPFFILLCLTRVPIIRRLPASISYDMCLNKAKDMGHH
jgi:hypothetical protein